MLENFLSRVGEMLSMWTEMGIRVPETIAKYTAFRVEVNAKKVFKFGSEEESYQRLSDLVGASTDTVTGGLANVTQEGLELTGITKGIQEQIANLMMGDGSGFAPQTVFEEAPTEVYA